MCITCEQVRELNVINFAPRKNAANGFRGECRKCRSIRARKNYSPKYKKRVKNGYLKRQYGINNLIYAKMLKNQKGVCAICKRKEKRILRGTKSMLSVDHNHKTGVIRGLLCYQCNAALGLFKDNIKLMKRAIKYLTKV